MTLEETIEVAVERAVERAFARHTPTAEPDCLLKVKDAAKLANVSTSTLHDWMARGLLTRRGEGRAVRVLRSEVLSVKPPPPTKKESPRATALKLLGDE